jgi:hypothetical protein
MIKRSVGLFSGFALLFLGVAIVFYSLKTTQSLHIKNASLSANIATASPGIIAMVLGVVLLLTTITSKDIFPDYGGEPTPAVDSMPPIPHVPYHERE